MTREAGLDPGRLDRLAEAITRDLASNRDDGCEIVVARHGVVALTRPVADVIPEFAVG